MTAIRLDNDDTIRVVLAGDCHGNPYFTRRLLAVATAAGAQRIWQLGDFGVWPGGEWFLDVVSAQAVAAGVTVEFIDGNHEDFSRIAAFAAMPRDSDGAVTIRPGLRWWPRGSVTEILGVRIGFLGGAVSVDQDSLPRVESHSWWPEEKPTDEDIDRLRANAGERGVEVLLTHDAPEGAGIRPVMQLPQEIEDECAVVRNRLRWVAEEVRAQLVVHGHWHQRATAYVRTAAGTSLRIESLAEEGDDGWLILELPTGVLFDPLTAS